MTIARAPRGAPAADGTRSIAPVDGAGALLERVRGSGGATVSELAAALGVARSTAVQRVDALVARGLLVSADAVHGARGRPAARLEFAPSAGVVLVAQLGLSGDRLALADLDGGILAETLVPSHVDAGAEEALDRLVDGLDELLAGTGRSRDDVAGAGIGMPSRLELAAHSRPGALAGDGWGREAVARRLGDRLGVPVEVDLDVSLIARVERASRAPGAEVFVCVKAGTVLDAAILVRGEPVRGAIGLAGELGHVKVPGESALCSCGGIGCLQTVASGEALVARLVDEGFALERVADVVALVERGEPAVVAAVREAGRRIGEALADVVSLLNPEAVAVWGYLAQAGEPLMAGIRESVHRDAVPESAGAVAVMAADVGELSGVRGAAAMIASRVLEPARVDELLTRATWSARGEGAVTA